MKTLKERVLNGLIKENPIFVMLIGMCPTLAVTTSATNGVGMGLSTTLVLVCSNIIISALRKVVPKTSRVPAFIVVIASLVTIVQFLLEGFVPSLYDSLGIYIPLIVVNCIILGRAESFASQNGIFASACDGLGMGLGFTFALTCIGAVREFLGAGTLFGVQILPLADSSAGTIGYTPITIFILAPGAFFVLALLIAIQNVFREYRRKKGLKVKEAQGGCIDGGCAACGAGCDSAAEEVKTDTVKAVTEKTAPPSASGINAAAQPAKETVSAQAENVKAAEAQAAKAPEADAPANNE